MNLPSNRHKQPLSKLAEKYNISLSSANRLAKSYGFSKTREQYEKDAHIRRETAYNLRQQGLKYREIGEMLGISTQNAQMLVRRYTAA
mgnify:CR=1 FL=1